jgi:hypothetical protein
MFVRLTILLLVPCALFGQDVSITAGALQTNPNALVLNIALPGGNDQVEHFFDQGQLGHKGAAYRIYVVSNPDEPEMAVEDVSAGFIDPNSDVQFGMDVVVLPLRKPLVSVGGQYYLIVVNGIGPKNRLIAKLDPKAAVISTGQLTIADQIKITSPIPLNNSVGDKLEVDRKKATVKNGQLSKDSEKIAAKVVQVDSDGLVVDLDKSLPIGTNSLSVVGLKDKEQHGVSAQGKVQIDPAPTNESNAYVIAKIGSNAAVHQSPVFTFTGNIGPWHPEVRAIFWGPIRFDPSTNVDVGLNTTKSANSIIVPSPFSWTFVGGLSNSTEGSDPSKWRKVNPWSMQIAFGPRLETDRDFNHLNTLGEFRSELYLPWLSKDMVGRKAKIAALHPEYRDFLELPTRGYSFAPYFQFDGGGHVNKETITNSKTKQSVVVPPYSIERTYFGFKGNMQYWLLSLDLDAYYVYMFNTETIGYTTSTNALLRNVAGWQPHSTASMSLYLNQAKHAAFNIKWEVGRTAPNFEYLNKVDVGFKLVY